MFLFFNLFIYFFNKKFINIFKNYFNLFYSYGIYIVIKGKFSKQNSLKKKKIFFFGNLKFSSKKTKLIYNSFYVYSLNGIFNIKIFLSFI